MVVINFVSYFGNAQGNRLLQQPITTSFSEQTLRTALTELEIMCDVHFTYNSELVNESKIINKTFFDESLEVVLSHIIGPGFEYKVFGAQIVISQKEEETAPKQMQQATKKVNKTTNASKLVRQIIKVYDTVRVGVYDTTKVTIVDSIRLYDTITIYETITVDSITETQWCLDLFYSGKILSSDLGNIKAEETAGQSLVSSVRGSALGVTITYRLPLFDVYAGLGISHMFDNLSYREENTWVDSSRWNNDSVSGWEYSVVDSYYKYLGNDSVWISVYDSVYTTTTFKHYERVRDVRNDRFINEYFYLTIPVGVKYNLKQLKDKKITVVGGLTPMFLLQSNVNVPDIDEGIVVLENKDVRKIQCELNLAGRYDQFLNANTSFFVQPGLDFMLLSRYKSIKSIHNRHMSFSLKCGISMNF